MPHSNSVSFTNPALTIGSGKTRPSGVRSPAAHFTGAAEAGVAGSASGERASARTVSRRAAIMPTDSPFFRRLLPSGRHADVGAHPVDDLLHRRRAGCEDLRHAELG